MALYHQFVGCGLRQMFVVVVCFLAATTVKADSFADKPFSLRFPAALSRFSPYADVAGTGGASAASAWSSSVNPASGDWTKLEGQLHLAVSPQYSAIVFDAGTVLQSGTMNLTWNAGDWGTFQLTATSAWSNDSATHQGVNFQYDMQYGLLQWGKRMNDQWAIGAAFSGAMNQTTFTQGPITLADSDGQSYDVRAGLIYSPDKRLRFGVVADYGWMPSNTSGLALTDFGLMPFEISDTTRQMLLRVGAAWEYAEQSTIYLDYQYGRFCDGGGNLEVHRLYGGADQRVFKWLFVRGGVAADNSGNFAGTTGLGVYPTDNVFIDIAYQYDMFPELTTDFGRSNTFTICLSILF
jgi:hypothetical protein